MASIAPSERLRRELDDLVAGVGEVEDPIEAIGRLGARLILQQALEDELTEFLGWGVRASVDARGSLIGAGNEPGEVVLSALARTDESQACINARSDRAPREVLWGSPRGLGPVTSGTSVPGRSRGVPRPSSGGRASGGACSARSEGSRRRSAYGRPRRARRYQGRAAAISAAQRFAASPISAILASGSREAGAATVTANGACPRRSRMAAETAPTSGSSSPRFTA